MKQRKDKQEKNSVSLVLKDVEQDLLQEEGVGGD